MRPGGKNGGKFKPRSLRDLAKQFLGIIIQTSEHDPVYPASYFIFYYFIIIFPMIPQTLYIHLSICCTYTIIIIFMLA